jgi:uncharacterized protein YsxB (DUF464 family)
MIQADFFESDGKLTGFRISGHSGYAESGSDIVCAAVSSAVQFAANTVTEGFGLKADVSAEGETVGFGLCGDDERAVTVIRMLKLHLECLSEDFPETIKITIRRCKYVKN